MTDPIAPPRRDTRYRLLVAVSLAVAATAMYLAVSRTNTDDDPPPVIASRPEVVQHLIPRSGAEALRQSELGIDLAPGYEGRLVVNGIEIPVEQLRIVEAENQVFFTPGPDKAIEALPAGRTCVTAVVWKSSEGRGTRDETFPWCFNVL